MPSPLPHLVQSKALISPCGRYRYLLKRVWDLASPPAVFVMLNPSTADATQDDPTIRRCLGFARTWGFGGIAVVNLFALRSKDPASLRTEPDPVGPHNDQHIRDLSGTGAVTVVAWGASNPDPERARAVLRILRGGACRLKCLRLTKAGEPAHPLRLPASTPLSDFPSDS
jgi:hypothetical protein